MAKKIKFESFKYRFLVAVSELSSYSTKINDKTQLLFINSLQFEYEDNSVKVSWSFPIPGNKLLSLRDIKLYVRGDRLSKINKANIFASELSIDSVKTGNAEYFSRLVIDIAESAGVLAPKQEVICQ